jgi:hypothetical protein
VKQDLGVLEFGLFSALWPPQSQHPPASPAHSESAPAAAERSLRRPGGRLTTRGVSSARDLLGARTLGAGWDGGCGLGRVGNPVAVNVLPCP